MRMVVFAFLSMSCAGAPTGGQVSATDAEDIVTLVKWEHAAVAAELTGDAEFHARHLSDDWTGGMINGEFQTKQMRLTELRDPRRNSPLKNQIRDVRVRLHGEIAIVTFTEEYDALVQDERIAKTIISTDVFQKRAGRWVQMSSHSSAVPPARK
jgi:hypothetical protein